MCADAIWVDKCTSHTPKSNGNLQPSWCIIYLDHMIIFSKTPDHQKIFEILVEAVLKLKPSKCKLFQKCTAYLGHLISNGGIETYPKKITATINWPRPKNVTDIRSFLGFTNNYQKFIYKYAQIASPLSPLTAGVNANKNKAIEWSEECEGTFNKLKDLCS